MDWYQEARDSVADVGHGVARGGEASSGSRAATVSVELLEGRTLRATVDERGWVSEERPTEGYETLHSLLMATSPLYKKSFADKIAAKLEALQRE